MFSVVESTPLQLFGKIALSALIFIYALHVMRYGRTRGRASLYLIFIPVCLLLRDIVLALLSVDAFWLELVMHGFSFAIVALYLGWFLSFYRAQTGLLLFVTLFALYLAVGVLSGLAFLPAVVYRIAFYLLVLGSFGYLLGYSYFAVFVGKSLEVQKTRVVLLISSGLTALLMFFPSMHGNIFVAGLFVPLSMTAHFFPFWAMTVVNESEATRNVVLRDTAIDNLFDFLREIGGALLSHQIIDRMLDFFSVTVKDTTEADGCVALLVDELNENLEVRALAGFYPPPYEVPAQVVRSRAHAIEAYFKSLPIPSGTTVFWEVLEQGKPVFYQELTDADRERIYGSATSTQDISSLIIVPLVVENRSFGIISLVKTGKHARFSDADYNHSLILTRYASLIIENRHNYLQILEKQQIEKEVNIASGIQASLIPQRIPRYPHIDVATFTKPLRGVSGDYFDILSQEGDECISILICDVAGKGVPASLLMVMIRTAFHLLSEQGHRDEGEVISEINRLIARTTAVDLFATLSLFSYWPEKGCIRYSSGGHLPLLLYRGKEGRTERFEAMDLPIGIDETIAYETKEIAVSRGDYVVIYTDGVIETRNTHNEEYGIDRLSEEVSTRAEKQVEAKGLLDGLIQNLSEFQERAEATDDRTLVITKLGGA